MDQSDMFKDEQTISEDGKVALDESSELNAIPPSSTDLNFILAFNTIDRERKGHITKQDLLRFLNKLVANAKFTIEDICNVYKRLKIDAGDDSDTVSYVQFMTAILPPPLSLVGNTTAPNTSGLNTMRGSLNNSIDDGSPVRKGYFQSVQNSTTNQRTKIQFASVT